MNPMSAEHRPLTLSDVLPQGPLRRLGREVFLHETIDSTNTFLLERAGELSDGAVAWGEFQTAGRGRLGRRWEAPRGSAILISILLHEPADSPVLTHGPMLGAVAACEAIEAATDCAPIVRWPNDILITGRKVGGVLVESRAMVGSARPTSGTVGAMVGGARPTAVSAAGSGTTPGRRAMVIGIGINCLQQDGHFKGELAQTATSLEKESHTPVSRARLAAVLLARLDDWLAEARDRPSVWPALRGAWQARCADVGQRVTLACNGRTFTGTVLDISADGDMIVELEHGGRRCFAAATTARLR